MTEAAKPTLHLHQSLITRHELLAAIALHARMVALSLDQHLTTDLSNLNFGWILQETARMADLAQAVIDASIAEQIMGGVATGKTVVTCDLTVVGPDGVTK